MAAAAVRGKRRMEFLGWLWWALAKLLGLVWSIGWFLLGGWVVTLVQLAVIGFVIYGYKYGWRRAPLEIARHGRTFGGFVWAWMRTRDVASASAPAKPRTELREVVGADRRRFGRSKEVGDINVSTLLSVLALLGLGVAALA
jgi:hypothetical protein